MDRGLVKGLRDAGVYRVYLGISQIGAPLVYPQLE